MLVTRREVLGGAVVAGGLMLAPWARATPPGRVFSCPIRVEQGRIVLEATLQSRSYRFLIDTGAPWSLIDNDLAKSLKLKRLPGRRQVAGIGGVSEFPWYDAGEVQFGAAIRLPHMLFIGAKAGFSPDLVGTFGSGLFTSYDSDLDFSQGEWRSYPDGRGSFAGLSRLPSRPLRGNAFDEEFGAKIVADATIGGFAGEFLLDTGFPGEASLEGSASAKSGLWNDARPYVPVQSRGIGKGRVLGRLVRPERMKIGPFACDGPLVTLDKPGSITMREGNGLIGLGLLRMLNLTIQVSPHTLWAAPSGLPRHPEDYAMSGLWLDGEGTDVTIADVGTGSPAAEAGLKVGDKVIGEFRALIRRINGPEGAKVPLTVERGGKRQDVVLTLTPYL